MSGSPAGRTQSRLETTFDSSDGVIVTTQTLTTTMGSDDEEEENNELSDQSKETDLAGQSEFYESAGGICGAGAEEELATVVVEPMQPLLPRASPYAYLKNYASTAVAAQTVQTSKGSLAKVTSVPKRSANHEQLPAGSVAMAAGSAGANRAAMVRAKSPRLLLNKPLGKSFVRSLLGWIYRII